MRAAGVIDRINDAVGRCVAPLIVVFIFLNRYFIQGLVGSGVKG
jgi:TRAP-type mannitol/chloroaromatic compound transport system permease small subunit